MAKEHIKKRFNIIKSTVRYNYTPSGIAKMKKTDNTCWQGCRATGTLSITGGNEKYHNYFEKKKKG
jgi:hypothetical protein